MSCYGRRLLFLAVLPIGLIRVEMVTAQGMCMPDAIKSRQVAGQVLVDVEGQQRMVVPGVKVEVADYQTTVIASTVTDKEGRFEIKDIKPGRYWLTTEHRIFMGLTVELTLEPADSGKARNNKSIVFVLGGDPLKPCGGGQVSVREIKPK